MAFSAHAQTTFIPLWAKETWLLDRMEIKAGTNNQLNLSTVKPYMRKYYVPLADSLSRLLLQSQNPLGLSRVDQYQLNRFRANSSEFSTPDTLLATDWKSRKPLFGFLWPTRGNMIEVDIPDFYMSINPLVSLQWSNETDYDQDVYVFSRGLTARGMIAKKIGFQFYATENQEQGPIQFRRFVDSNRAVPGAGYSKDYNNGKGRDYFDARGSVTWNVTRFVDMQFGYDQHFIGNGYRSLVYGNFGPPHLFLKFNTRAGKFNYTNIFSELIAPVQESGDNIYKKQYSATHHLSFNALPWLNLGAFETVVFGELNNFNLSHLNPVIFLNTLLRDKDGNTNSMIGLDAKANFARHFQVYGQWTMQAFNGDKSGGDFWGNRHGLQAGAKYIDAFGLKNFDLQAEYNQVRPFTYSSPENAGSWTNYRQQMAHPLGSNFREVVGMFRFQPWNRLYVYGRLNYWQQGRDSARYNFGSNPRVDNSLVSDGGRRLRNNHYPLLSGTETEAVNTAITVSYEIKENMFIDLNNLYRFYRVKVPLATENTNVLSVGFRWNMFRRDYDY